MGIGKGNSNARETHQSDVEVDVSPVLGYGLCLMHDLFINNFFITKIKDLTQRNVLTVLLEHSRLPFLYDNGDTDLFLL